jgi:hypothetical protein
MRSRTTAEPKATIRSPVGRVAGATMLLRHAGDHEPVRIGRLEVDEQAGDRVHLGRDLGLARRPM